MHISKDQLEPLAVNGFNGRLLRVPARIETDRQILLIYGIHSSHERMYPMATFLSHYGHVTEPDLPGIGGMDSFYSRSQKPSIDMYADYLYALLKTRRPGSPITVVAMSFGFIVLTRMLQRHEDSIDWFDDIISFVGFGRSADFKNIELLRRRFQPLARLLKTRLGSQLVSVLIFNPLSLRVMFALFRLFNPKYKYGTAYDKQASLKMELDLWRKNDARTRFAIYDIFFNFDLTTGRTKLPLGLHDMTTPQDQYFDAERVNQSLRLLFETVSISKANMTLHAPSIIGSETEVETIFSSEAKAILSGQHER